MDQHLRMAASPENVSALFEFVAQLGMIENFASRHENNLAILVRQRLAVTADIGNAQSDMCEANLPA
jgi:hypothetical protein